MYKEMRRKANQRDEAAAYDYLKAATWGVLSLAADGLPYGVPLSHGLIGKTLYFHSAREGQKIDFLRANPVGWYTAVPSQVILPAGATVHYECVMACGPLRVVEEERERHDGLHAINLQNGILGEDSERFIAADGPRALVLALDIERITAKCTKKEGE